MAQSHEPSNPAGGTSHNMTSTVPQLNVDTHHIQFPSSSSPSPPSTSTSPSDQHKPKRPSLVDRARYTSSPTIPFAQFRTHTSPNKTPSRPPLGANPNRTSVSSFMSVDSVPEADEDDPAAPSANLSPALSSPSRRGVIRSRPNSRPTSPTPSVLSRRSGLGGGSRPSSPSAPPLAHRASFVGPPTTGRGRSSIYGASEVSSHGGYRPLSIMMGPSPPVVQAQPQAQNRMSFPGAEEWKEGELKQKETKEEKECRKEQEQAKRARRADKRWKIALELRESERTYAEVLDVIETYYYHPLVHSLPAEALPPARRASMRASQASAVASPIEGPPSIFQSTTGSRPHSFSSQAGLGITVFPSSSDLPAPAPATAPSLDTPPRGGPILSHKSITEVFSNLEDVKNLAHVMLDALDREVPDMPTKPVAVSMSTSPAAARSPIATQAQAGLASGSAPGTPEQPGLSSSTGTIDSVSGPQTPEQSSEDVSASNLTARPKANKSKRRSSSAAAAQPLAVGRALLSVLPFLKSYSVFVANFERSTKALGSLRTGTALNAADDPARWVEFLKERNQAGLDKGVGLGGMLLNVVQRVPRYRFLIADLLDHTEPDHPDYSSLQQAYKLADEVATHLEQQLENESKEAKMVALTRAFGGRGLEGRELVVPGRKLVKAGRLRKLDRRGGEQMRTFLLFNDMFMHASQEGDWLGKGDGPVVALPGRPKSVGGGPDGWHELGLEQGQEYRCHRMMKLEHLTVVGTDESGVPGAGGEEGGRKYSFEVLAPEKSFALFAGSLKDKLEWIEAIREAKAELMSDRRTLQRTESTPRVSNLARTHSSSRVSATASSHAPRDRRISLPASASRIRPSLSRLNNSDHQRSSLAPALVQIPPTPSPTDTNGLFGKGVVSSPGGMGAGLSASASGPIAFPKSPAVVGGEGEDYFALRRASPSVSPSPSATSDLSGAGASVAVDEDGIPLFVMEDYSAPIWVPDNTTNKCKGCSEVFIGAWRRRHHCRLCGGVVCWACSQRNFVIPALEEGEEAKVARACDGCYESVIVPRMAGTPSPKGEGPGVGLSRRGSGVGGGERGEGAMEWSSLRRHSGVGGGLRLELEAEEEMEMEGGGGGVRAEFVAAVRMGKGTVRTRLRSFKR